MTAADRVELLDEQELKNDPTVCSHCGGMLTQEGGHLFALIDKDHAPQRN